MMLNSAHGTQFLVGCVMWVWCYFGVMALHSKFASYPSVSVANYFATLDCPSGSAANIFDKKSCDT